MIDTGTPETSKTSLKSQTKATNSSPDLKEKNNLATMISILAFLCAGASLSISVLNYHRGSLITPAHDSGGNATKFTDGTIASIANKVAPSVVSITTETRNQGWYGQTTSTAAGTGFIISADGYVLTNKHVVSGSNSITILLDNGEVKNNVKLIGVDPLNDVAILKIKDVNNLKPLPLGNSRSVNLGQQVIAVGNTLGQYQNSVTEGIISGLGRSIIASDSSGGNVESLNDMLQTDASINQGNSGGPLLNAAGEVIGINTAVSSGNGLGFAIPISSVKGIVKNVLKNGDFKRAYLGVYYTNLTPAIAKANNLPTTSGAYINSAKGTSVIKGSAADRAGLKDKDIITAVGEVKIGRAGSLASLIGEYAVGDTVKITINRGGEIKDLEITLDEFKSDR